MEGTNPTRPYYIRFFCEPPKAALFRYHKMRPSVLKPAGLVAIKTKGFFFTITYYIYPTRIYTLRYQELLGRVSTTLTKGNIIVVCSSFVTMPLNFYSHSRIFLEECSILLKSFFSIVIKIVFIKIKMDIL